MNSYIIQNRYSNECYSGACGILDTFVGRLYMPPAIYCGSLYWDVWCWRNLEAVVLASIIEANSRYTNAMTQYVARENNVPPMAVYI